MKFFWHKKSHCFHQAWLITLVLVALAAKISNQASQTNQKSTTKNSNQNKTFEFCPAKSPLLLGQIFVKILNKGSLVSGSKLFIDWFGPHITEGGSYQPSDCQSRQKLAIIVPYRDREDHLITFLHHIHPILQRQQVTYQIFVIQQSKEDLFNRGALMNVGFKESLKFDNFDCYVFHDVDLLSEDDRNLYTCHKEGPKHISVAVDTLGYRLPYPTICGGVLAIFKEHFEQINGFFNSLYGWGGEDDDLSRRIQRQNLTIVRSPANIARFHMLEHDQAPKNSNLTPMMLKSESNKLMADGLTTLEYEKLAEKKFSLYTWILVRLPKDPQATEKPSSKSLKEKMSEGLKLAMFSIQMAKTVAKGTLENNISFENVEKTNLIY